MTHPMIAACSAVAFAAAFFGYTVTDNRVQPAMAAAPVKPVLSPAQIAQRERMERLVAEAAARAAARAAKSVARQDAPAAAAAAAMQARN